MYYDIENPNHGLLHDPLKALVSPRPIAWVGSISPDGRNNLAPYSFFNLVSDRPAMIMFSSCGHKDSLENINATLEFSLSIVSQPLIKAMNMSSATVASDVDEFELAGLTPVPCVRIAAPRVRESPAALECRLWKVLPLRPNQEDQSLSWTMVIASIVGVHISEEVIVDRKVDTKHLLPVGRLGYMEYCSVSEQSIFELQRPVVNPSGYVVGEK